MKANQPVKVGVIGTGWWACEAHLPAIDAHSHACIHAIQTRKEDRAQKLCKTYGIPHWCASWEDLLAIPELDAVIICSTPQVHYEQVKAALERGLHVLVEKPMTLDAVQSGDLVDLAQSRGLHFLISSPWHYTRQAIQARLDIESGRLGDIRFINVFMTNFTLGLYEGKSLSETLAGSDGIDSSLKPEIEPDTKSYSDPSVSGGGQIFTQASHVFAFLGFLTGLETTEVFARFDNTGTVVDNANALTIRFSDHVLASVGTLATHSDLERFFEIRVIGNRGIATMELWKGTYRLVLSDGTVEESPLLSADEVYPKCAPATNLIDCILGNSPNGSPAKLGHYAMQIISAACESNRSGLPVSVSAPADADVKKPS